VRDAEVNDHAYAGSVGEDIEAKGGKTGLGEELRFLLLLGEIGTFEEVVAVLEDEAAEEGRSVSDLILFDSFDEGPRESRVGDWPGCFVVVVDVVVVVVVVAGAEKDCSKGFGSRSKSERVGRTDGRLELWSVGEAGD
jgi:hypothetical protein